MKSEKAKCLNYVRNAPRFFFGMSPNVPHDVPAFNFKLQMATIFYLEE